MRKIEKKFNEKDRCFDYYIDDICIGEVTYSNRISWTADNKIDYMELKFTTTQHKELVRLLDLDVDLHDSDRSDDRIGILVNDDNYMKLLKFVAIVGERSI